MKKAALLIILFILIISLGIYEIYPEKSRFTQTTINDVSETNAARFLIRKSNWRRWWPGQSNAKDSNLFVYKGIQYRLTQSSNNGMSMLITNPPALLKGKMSYNAEDNLKVKITWAADMDAGKNIFKRIQQHKAAEQAEEDITFILNHLKGFLGNDRNVYEFNIHLAKVHESVMLATSSTFNKYPDMTVVDPMIKKLKRLIKAQNAFETSYPMLNIHQLSKQEYEVTVAIPINKEVKAKENTMISKMVDGNMLEANVKGGPNTINNAFVEIKNFAKDYRLTAPAMPFESLVTDRAKEKDTAKWLTNIHYPIF